jgi:hypothetical protein
VVVVIDGGPKTVMVSDWVAVPFVGLAESVTLTVNVWEVLVAVGVPEIHPSGLRVSPAGSVPESRVQTYGVLPPEANRG